MKRKMLAVILGVSLFAFAGTAQAATSLGTDAIVTLSTDPTGTEVIGLKTTDLTLDAATNTATFSDNGIFDTNTYAVGTVTIADPDPLNPGGTIETITALDPVSNTFIDTVNIYDAGANLLATATAPSIPTSVTLSTSTGPVTVTGVADGVAPNDAVNRGQLDAERTDRINADNALAAENVVQDNRIKAVENDIVDLKDDVKDLKGGVALGIAAASHQYDFNHQGLQASAALGYYDSKGAFSFGMGGNVGGNMFINANVGVTTSGKAGAGVAVGFKF